MEIGAILLYFLYFGDEVTCKKRKEVVSRIHIAPNHRITSAFSDNHISAVFS